MAMLNYQRVFVFIDLFECFNFLEHSLELDKIIRLECFINFLSSFLYLLPSKVP